MSNFQRLRDQVVGIADSSDTSHQTLMRFNDHTATLVPRLSGYESELNYSFEWYDGFKTSRKFSGSSLYVDWAGFAWIIRAIESQRGARMDRSTDDGFCKQINIFKKQVNLFEILAAI